VGDAAGENVSSVAAPAPIEAPAAAPEGKYTRYAGRAITLKVPHPTIEGKTINRNVRDAKAALDEADDRASKFEALVECLQR
jgi:hypothetical protein